jgi:Raf kinase inhibitor-like YbhB/YbcL family protein
MRGLSSCVLCLTLILPVSACSPQKIHQTVTNSLRLSSTTTNGGNIPDRCGCKGAGASPELSWTDPPPGTKGFALVMDDRDAALGHLHRHYFVHWLAFDLDPTRRELPEAIAKQSLGVDERLGSNDVPTLGYLGPCPDSGSTHHYALTLYALDVRLGLPEGTNGRVLLKAIDGHILARGELMGTYTR